MKIVSLEIHGFKSIEDVSLGQSDLTDLNVLYGRNNVGKSNLFQAIDWWQQMVHVGSGPGEVELEPKYGTSLYRLGSNSQIQVKVELATGPSGQLARWVREAVSRSRNLEVSPEAFTYAGAEVCASQAPLGTRSRLDITAYCRVDGTQAPMELAYLQRMPPFFRLIRADRRFQSEQLNGGNNFAEFTDANLKRGLFYAYLSADPQQKARLAAISRILADPPFELGKLDVALQPQTNSIDIGFLRPDGRLPLENMGSGVQQLLLVLGQIFLNQYPVVAIEEPEMNLSPFYQEHLLSTLRRLMGEPSVGLEQLFISSHSPYFEFAENFFDVTMDAQGRTHVERLPMKERDRYFSLPQSGPDSGARINSINQVTLYEGLIHDLGLQRGDLILFVKNEAGQWEIRPERDVTPKLKAAFNGQDDD